MSGASSLRNAVKRVAHKERAQPSERKKFGLLEKHKDYVERAKDFKKKKNYIETLRKKASERNPDEFYFHMHNSKVQNGRHFETAKDNLDQETLKLLKTQDLGYILHKKALDEKKVTRLKENIHLIGDVHPKQHVIFAADEQQLADFDPVQHFGTIPEFVDRHYNRIKSSQLDSQNNGSDSLETVNDLAAGSADSSSGRKRKQRSEELKEINERTKRAKRLTSAFEELSQQRNLARCKGARKKITVQKTVGREKKEKEVTLYKWRRERAR